MMGRAAAWLLLTSALGAASEEPSDYFGVAQPPEGQVFRFNNGGEPLSLDPHKADGQPDSRIVWALFEGLTAFHPEKLTPEPAAAESWDVSPDGLVYTFRLRRDAHWSNGQPLTAHDFVYSWRRLLDPATKAPLAFLLFGVKNAERFHSGQPSEASTAVEEPGIQAVDDRTFQVTLDTPMPYFPSLCAMFPLVPVHRPTLERWGEQWIRPDRMVSNGAFKLQEHRFGDKIVLVRDESYWDAANVRLQKVVAHAIELYTDGTSRYQAGELDLVPSSYIQLDAFAELRKKRDYHASPYLATYFYRLNVTHPVLKDKRIRQALSLSIDRVALCDRLKAEQLPGTHLVPPGVPGYEPPKVLRHDPEAARRLLAEAGYPEGKGFPQIVISYNQGVHQEVAGTVQQMWKRELGIDVGLNDLQWGIHLRAQQNLAYDVSRSGWIGDYLDPNTFLALWVTGASDNKTGWSDERYDRLIAEAARERDPAKRLTLFREAETLLLEELPILPLYIYMTEYLLKPYVQGYYPNVLDVHPLKAVRLDQDWQARPAEQD